MARPLRRTGRYLGVVSGDAKACPAAQAAAGRCWTGAALYDPTANRWTVLSLPAPFDGLGLAGVVWTGRDLIVAAVSPVVETNLNAGLLAVAAYSRMMRRWQLLTPARRPRARRAEPGLHHMGGCCCGRCGSTRRTAARDKGATGASTSSP